MTFEKVFQSLSSKRPLNISSLVWVDFYRSVCLYILYLETSVSFMPGKIIGEGKEKGRGAYRTEEDRK